MSRARESFYMIGGQLVLLYLMLIDMTNKEIWIGLDKSRGGRTNRRVSLPDVVFPCRVTRHNALRCITSCYSFRYNKQLIAQLVGRHEDLSHPENSSLPRAPPSGDMNFQGGTNLRVSLQTGQ